MDYGGVLTNALEDAVGGWLRAERIDPERFVDLMRRWLSSDGEPTVMHDLETGRIDVADFERQLGAQLAADQLSSAGAAQPIEDPVGMLTRMAAGLRPAAGMIAVVRAARTAGIRTGLLSNSWGLDYPRDGWDELFDTVVISGEVGLRKPQPEIYLLAAQRLGLPPGQIVFVDDLAPNVQGAVAVGMVGVHHVDAETTVGELEILLGLSLR